MGEVTVTSSKGSLVFGSFSPAPNFRPYEQLFKEFERAANDQLFVEVDRLERKIAQLGFFVIGPFPQEDRLEIEDLQIMGGDLSFRVK